MSFLAEQKRKKEVANREKNRSKKSSSFQSCEIVRYFHDSTLEDAIISDLGNNADTISIVAEVLQSVVRTWAHVLEAHKKKYPTQQQYNAQNQRGLGTLGHVKPPTITRITMTQTGIGKQQVILEDHDRPVLLTGLATVMPQEWLWLLDGLTVDEWSQLSHSIFDQFLGPIDQVIPMSPGTCLVPWWLITPEEVRVVIIGPYPYRKNEECMGYAFSSSKHTVTLRDLQESIEQEFDVAYLAQQREIQRRRENEDYGFFNHAEQFKLGQMIDLAEWVKSKVLCLNVAWVTRCTGQRDDAEGVHPCWIKLMQHLLIQLHRHYIKHPWVIVTLGKDADQVVTPEMEHEFCEQEPTTYPPCQVLRRHWLNRSGMIKNTLLWTNINLFLVEHGGDPIDFSSAIPLQK